MKRVISLMLCMLPLLAAYALPVRNYTVTTDSMGTYTEITDGTVIATFEAFPENANARTAYLEANTPVTEATTGEGFPIGFVFEFNNIMMERFAVGSHMWINLGYDEVTIDPTVGAAYRISGAGNVICHDIVMANSLQAGPGSEISYKTEGAEGHRTLTVQYKDFYLRSTQDTVRASLQIRLAEEDNTVTLIYKGWTPSEDWRSTSVFYIGIGGNEANNWVNVNGDNDSTWNAPNILKATDAEMNNSPRSMSFNADNHPKDGLTITFTPPAWCAAPTAAPEGLTVTPGSHDVSGSFTATEDADNYLVLLSEGDSLTTMPANGIYYAAGEELGSATVLYYGQETSFSMPEDITLDEASAYHIFVVPVQAECTLGPMYWIEAVATAAFNTMPAAPADLTIEMISTDRMAFSAEANAAGNNIIVGMTQTPDTVYAGITGNPQMTGYFGQPTAALQAGEEIPGGGTVIYNGPATSGITAEGLNSNDIYRFAAWSVDAEGNVSTARTDTFGLTLGEMPYNLDLEGQNADGIYGWETEGGWGKSGRTSEDYVLYCRTQPSADGTVTYAQTQWIRLNENPGRVLMDYNIVSPASHGSGGSAFTNWDAGDTLALLVTPDEVNYDTLFIQTESNHDDFTSAEQYLRAYGSFGDAYAGDSIKVKIFWRTRQNLDITVNYLNVDEGSDCIFPTAITVTDIAGPQATVAWRSQGNETRWEVRFREEGGEWCDPIAVSSNPCTLTGLPTQTTVELQVRSVCSMSSHSDWSQSVIFTGGYVIPFSESFSDAGIQSMWEARVGTLATPTEFCTGDQCNPQWGFISLMGRYNYAAISGIAARTTTDDWFIFPALDFGDGSVNYNLTFTLTVNQANAESDETYYIVASRDGGETFNEADVLDTITKAELPASGSASYTTSLRGLSGIVRLAIYIKATNGTISSFLLSTVAVEPTCPNDVQITVADTASTSARITWTGTKDEGQPWLVYWREAGSTAREYTEQQEAELNLTGLTPRTTYEVGVTKACAEGDTAKAVTVSFTTEPDTECAQVTGINVVPADYSAQITWNGTAMEYEVQFREEGTEEWYTVTTEANNVTITDLMPETTYEYAINSVCSPYEGDESGYTGVSTFTTASILCPAPANITVEAAHAIAEVTWDGNAASYTLYWRAADESQWQTADAEENTYTLTDLLPETDYQLYIVAHCSEELSSQPSATVTFTTEPTPECGVPTDLTATEVTDTTIAVTWTSAENNLTWNLRYRTSDESSYTEVTGIEETAYTLRGLTPGTLYLWSVMGNCDDGRKSNYASNARTTTDNTSAVELVDRGSLTLFAADDIINVINSEHLFISRIAVYTASGALLGDYTVNSEDNVIIPLNSSRGVLIVRITTDSGTAAYKVMAE